jgi:AAA ATPase domain
MCMDVVGTRKRRRAIWPRRSPVHAEPLLEGSLSRALRRRNVEAPQDLRAARDNPTVPGSLVTARLLEREHELAQLEGALHGALDDEGRAVVVQGTAGIGKTALLDAAARSAREQGIEVLGARADSLESDLSFGVCMQLFQRLAEASGEDGPDPFAGAAAFARPVLGGGSVMGAPGEDRTLPLINGLYWLWPSAGRFC